jgi:hypothetical protein
MNSSASSAGGSRLQDLIGFAYKSIPHTLLAVAILTGFLVYSWSKPNDRKFFPVWATLELALTIFVVGRGGLVLRI